MKITIVDTYYPAFLESIALRSGRYEELLTWTLGRCFGTFDAYSRNLRDRNWVVTDIIANHNSLQSKWAGERGLQNFKTFQELTLAQIEESDPDVVFMQDLSFFDAAALKKLSNKYILAGQCSCPMPTLVNVQQFYCLFTSFPHYVEAFQAMGVPVVDYVPLAFDPMVYERSRIPKDRTLVSFVGGYGHHWKIDELLITLAEQTPIQFWGYGFNAAPEPVRKRYRGPAWGLDMYQIYFGSHIVFNRHGAVAQGYANNLRLFEATGCGAMLLTDYAPNLTDFFSDGECATYISAQDAADQINYYLQNPDEMKQIASAGQRRTISTHTYAHRMDRVSRVLQSCLSSERM